VKNNRETLDSRWDKHDTKDAANVADLVSQGKCLFYESPSEEILQIRSLLSLIKKLKKIRQAFTVRIRNHLIAQYFPELDRYWKYAEHSVIAQKGLNHRFIAEMSLNDFILLAASKRGTREQQKRLYEIREAARSSIGCAHHAAVSFEATVLADSLKGIDTMIRNTALQLEKICSLLPEYAYLVSIPGFGPLISAMVIGAIGNPYRFENAGQVLKAAGLDLSSNRSGKRTRART
jgi:transposase